LGEVFKLKKTIVILILLPILSVCIVLITPFLIPANIDSYEEFQNAKFGFPVPYIKQNLLTSGADGYEGGFPHKFGLQLDFLDKEPEFEFAKINFIFSIGIVYCIFLLFYYLSIKREQSKRKIKRRNLM
jgi:hypothetical protein